MRETVISATEFKAKCLAILDQVASGKSVVVTKRGKPVARVTPATQPRRSSRGSMVGRSEEVGDIVHFDTSDLWEVLR